MGGLASDPNSVSHIIQTALTPIFFLSGIGTLLNVFNQRLARVSDHYSHISEMLRGSGARGELADGEGEKLLRHLRRLSRRRVALDVSVAFLALGGAGTCGAAFTLFLVTLRDTDTSSILLWLFGGALGFTIAALMAFLVDTVLSWHGLRIDGPMPNRPSA